MAGGNVHKITCAQGVPDSGVDGFPVNLALVFRSRDADECSTPDERSRAVENVKEMRKALVHLRLTAAAANREHDTVPRVVLDRLDGGAIPRAGQFSQVGRPLQQNRRGPVIRAFSSSGVRGRRTGTSFSTPKICSMTFAGRVSMVT